MYTQTDKQVDRQLKRQTYGIQRIKQTERLIDIWTDRQPHWQKKQKDRDIELNNRQTNREAERRQNKR